MADLSLDAGKLRHAVGKKARSLPGIPPRTPPRWIRWSSRSARGCPVTRLPVRISPPRARSRLQFLAHRVIITIPSSGTNTPAMPRRAARSREAPRGSVSAAPAIRSGFPGRRSSSRRPTSSASVATTTLPRSHGEFPLRRRTASSGGFPRPPAAPSASRLVVEAGVQDTAVWVLWCCPTPASFPGRRPWSPERGQGARARPRDHDSAADDDRLRG